VTGGLASCPGCGLRAPAGGIELDRPFNASPECWATMAEVTGFELLHQVPLGRLHQLVVDAYGAQHAGPPTGERRVVYSLVGLCLAVEHGWTGTQVRDLHARMGRPQPAWPRFTEPAPSRATVTVWDVAEAGARRGAVDGHERAVEAWARAVWDSWAPRHDEVRGLVRLLVA
jgi:hypothetical protein